MGQPRATADVGNSTSVGDTMGFDAISWEFMANSGNTAAFWSQVLGMFLTCSCPSPLWISLCAAIRPATRMSRGEFSARARPAPPAAHRGCSPVGPSRSSTLRKSASATIVAWPLPMRQRATRRSLLIAQVADQRSGRGGEDRRGRRASRCLGPRSSGASSRSPQCLSSPVSAKAGGGRSGSPSGRSLVPFEHAGRRAAAAARRPAPSGRDRPAPRPAGPAGAPSAASRLWPSVGASAIPIGDHLVARRPAPSAPASRRLPGRISRRTPAAGSSAASASASP